MMANRLPTTSERFVKQSMLDLISHIKNYESDTFSAYGSKLTNDEVYDLAGRLIHILIDEKIDGIVLSQLLDEIR